MEIARAVRKKKGKAKEIPPYPPYGERRRKRQLILIAQGFLCFFFAGGMCCRGYPG